MTKQEWMKMYDIIGASLEVYNQLGRGMEESIYQEALMIELTDRGIPFEREKLLHTYYKNRQLQKVYQADFYSEGIMIELKSVSQFHSEHYAQLFNYMRITNTMLGIIINYGEKNHHAERYIYIPEDDDFILLTRQNYLQYITDK